MLVEGNIANAIPIVSIIAVITVTIIIIIIVTVLTSASSQLAASPCGGLRGLHCLVARGVVPRWSARRLEWPPGWHR